MSSPSETTDNSSHDREALIHSDEKDEPDKSTESQGNYKDDTSKNKASKDDNAMETKDSMTMQETMEVEDSQHDRIDDLTKR